MSADSRASSSARPALRTDLPDPPPVSAVPPANQAFVGELLTHLDRVQWPGAPRPVGVDRMGRQVVTEVDGHRAWEPAQPPSVWSRPSLERVATLVRQLHDLTTGTHLAGEEEVVCHNDLGPAQTIYRDTGDGLRPVAFVGWDHATPGRRVHDLAVVCWRYVGLGPGRTSAVGAGRLMRGICAAYGPVDRHELVETVRWAQARRWAQIEDGAAAGDPTMVALRDAGGVEEVRDSYEWVTEHRDVLEAAMR